MTKRYEDHLESRSEICGGAPVIKGTRIRLKVVLDSLAEGHSPEQIADAYPSLTLEDIYAVISYAAASASDECDNPLPASLTA